MRFVILCVTRRFCDVSWICSRLKAPFRPSANSIRRNIDTCGSELAHEDAGPNTLFLRLYRILLRITQRFCDVSWICSRLKAPFRPSASDFEGSK
ncbi:hypothetical protein B0B36_24855 [Pseudomonas syringae pv. actinidifoliorum]|nr:hypothetical protein B0B36_24855 [Pseudomonas syringae pv. actinidifoliorum]